MALTKNWQTQLSTVREHTQYAFNNSLFCDVKFMVQDSINGGKVTVPANKYMLAISSPVFEAMFYSDLNEKQDTINLPDCTKDALQELLRYVHSNEVNLTADNVMEVLYMAHKYFMPFLVTECREFLQEHLKPEEVFSVLPQFQKMNEKQLEQHCWVIVDKKTRVALSSKPFLEISREMLCQVLIRDTLRIKELEIFYAVDKWADNKIKESKSTGETKRAILGEEVIRLIRFPLMSQKELAEVVMPSEILEKGELTEVFQILTKVTRTTNFFSNKERWMGAEAVLIKNRFTLIMTPMMSYKDNKVDAVCFLVSKPMTLIGVQLFGNQGSSYDVNLEILKNGEIVSALHSSYSSELVNEQYYGFAAILHEPVSLDPNITYTVKAVINGPRSFSGEAGQKVVDIGNGVTIIYQNSNISTNGTGVYTGQFPSLLVLAFS